MYFHVKRATKQTIMGTLLLRAAVEARSALLWFRWPHSQFSINKKRCCHCSTALWAVLLTNSPSITLRLMLFVRRRNSQGPFNGISGNLLWWKCPQRGLRFLLSIVSGETHLYGLYLSISTICFLSCSINSVPFISPLTFVIKISSKMRVK